jgi:hypothetical protein
MPINIKYKTLQNVLDVTFTSHPVMEWNATITITDMKFHFKNNAFGATTTTITLK